MDQYPTNFFIRNYANIRHGQKDEPWGGKPENQYLEEVCSDTYPAYSITQETNLVANANNAVADQRKMAEIMLHLEETTDMGKI